MGQFLVADDEDAFWETRQLLVRALDAFDYQGSRGSSEHLRIREAVDMRVIPVQAGRLVGRNSKIVLKWRISGLNCSMENVVLVADWRHGCPVKMQVRGKRVHGCARARSLDHHGHIRNGSGC